jgi:hypothetical protein
MSERFQPLSLLLAAGLTVAAVLPVAAQEPLTLRINDTAGEADGLMAVVLRTYASRPVHQGQICFQSQFSEATGSPFASFVDAIVFSGDGNATTVSSFDPNTGEAIVEFFSAGSTINAVDGPLAVFFFQLDPALTPGQQFVLSIDPANTLLLDENDNPIPIMPRSGDLTVISPGAPRALDADAGKAAPGSLMTLAASTESIFPIVAGQVGIRFDPAVVVQVVDAFIDPRYGIATWNLSTPSPGLAVVTFESPDGSLNWLPGSFLSLRVRIASNAVPGTQSVVSLDPEHTYLLAAEGSPVAINLGSDLLEIVPADLIFGDGFEGGGFNGWSAVVP